MNNVLFGGLDTALSRMSPLSIMKRWVVEREQVRTKMVAMVFMCT